MKLNNNLNKELSFVDLLSIASFLIGLENLNANLTQNDKADLQHDLSNQTSKILQEVHKHLESQDNKIELILKQLEALK